MIESFARNASGLGGHTSEMKKETIRNMICPYCLGSFSIVTVIKGSPTRVEYGLVKCGCFEFPIIEGVLMLALSKGYGGAEEYLQPYVAIQAAAITMIKRSDINSFKVWIRNTAPLVARLCSFGESYCTYGEYIAYYDRQLRRAIVSYLRSESKYVVLGGRTSHELNHTKLCDNWYYSRFITPRAARLRHQVFSAIAKGRILSLCCGHGIVEHHLSGHVRGSEIVSIDGQLINLLIVRKFINPCGDFICHDLQLSLPFRDSYFQSSVSSTCIPEIPAHATFIKEAVRVTSDDGCTLLDSIWAAPGRRIDPLRYYRFCQNEFDSRESILRLLLKCADGRSVKLYFPENVLDRVWASGPDWNRVLTESTDPYISALIGDAYREVPLSNALLCQTDMKKLHLCPLYRIVKTDLDTLHLRRKPTAYGPSLVSPEPSMLPEQFTIARSRLADWSYLTTLFQYGVLNVLPTTFGAKSPSLRSLSRL